MVNLQTLYQEHNEASFRQQFMPVGVLLEGTFQSAFKNRIVPKEQTGDPIRLINESRPTEMLVVADGDIIKNQLNVINPNIPRGTPLPVGFDQYTNTQYGNKDFILNAIDYMLDDSGLISIRSRELTLRLLDFNVLKAERNYWQALNTALPIALVIVFGLLHAWLRRRKYAH
jgi:gliding-associated putative ABC transporter substrate-binding component GldG